MDINNIKKKQNVTILDGTMKGRAGKVVSISKEHEEIGVRIEKEVLYFSPSNLKAYGGFVAVSFNPTNKKHFKNLPSHIKN